VEGLAAPTPDGPVPESAATRVLVVEDDPTVSEVVARYLTREGYAVEEVADGTHAVERALHSLPDLVVVDLMIPGLDGLEVCRRLRLAAPIPVIMLTAKSDEADRIAGLELGADDYVSKPFSPRELMARIRSVLRRARGDPWPQPAAVPSAGPVSAGPAPDGTASTGSSPSGAVLTAGRISVDLGAHETLLAGRLVALTAKEFDLLVFLMRHPRQAFSREELLEQVWGYTYGDTSTVTVHIRRLREKIEADPADPRHVVTVWSVGYRFEQ
jgi:DNA-binding response OmpR family regulator